MIAWDVAVIQNGLYIKTDKPQDDFVVICHWSSGFFVLHGGAKKVKRKVLITTSNSEVDCGWSLFGGNLSVTVLHPLYARIRGCDRPAMCEQPNFRYQDGKMIFTPVAFDKYLLSLTSKREKDELSDFVRAVVSGHFDFRYYRNYVKVKKPNIKQFKTLYYDQLLNYWKIGNTLIDSNEDWLDPEKAMKFRWSKFEKYVLQN